MVTKKKVKHIAKLARLGLTEKEIEKFRKELSSILDYFEQLKQLDVTKVEPCSHPFFLENVMREDEAKQEPTDRVDKLIEAAPERKGRYVKVKSIL